MWLHAYEQISPLAGFGRIYRENVIISHTCRPESSLTVLVLSGVSGCVYGSVRVDRTFLWEESFSTKSSSLQGKLFGYGPHRAS